MLAWLMDRTTLVCWLFVIILGLGYVASTKLGREFMADLYLISGSVSAQTSACYSGSSHTAFD
jgi:hypothetical protein